MRLTSIYNWRAENNVPIVKRVMDVTFALPAGLIVAIPVIGMMAIQGWRLGDYGIFKQERVGKDEELFTVLKIKTMRDQTDKAGKTLKIKDRCTKWDIFLRSSRLDELPQIWNILKGDMSIVGPRPLLPTDDAAQRAKNTTRHSVKPGLTGLAQLCGNATSDKKKVEQDIQYIETMSLWGDLLIIIRTPYALIKNSNAPHHNHQDPSPRPPSP